MTGPDAVPEQSPAGDAELTEHFMQALDDAEQAAVVVPDEAVEAAAEAAWPVPRDRDFVRVLLAAAAPFIVAANQPKTEYCDLRETLLVTILGTDDGEIVHNDAELPVGEIARLIIEHAVPAVQAWVAANQPDASGHPDLDAIRGRYRAADFATDEPWAAALNDVVLSSWLDVPALLAEVERLRAQYRRILAADKAP